MIVDIPKNKNQIDSPIQRIDAPESVYVQLDGCRPLVKEGTDVDAGTLIAISNKASQFERHIHSPYTGIVTSVSPDKIGIKGEWPNTQTLATKYDVRGISPEEIRERCRLAGVVGMGGAMTPTYFKLSSVLPIDKVLVNICESEPYICCDNRVLEEYFDEVEGGLKLAMMAVGAERGLIAPKRESYISGYEVFLVEETLGRKVPKNGRPIDVGALVLNLQTIRSIYFAVFDQHALTQRVITVDGESVKRPGNYLVPIGTRVGHILEYCGWDKTETDQIIIGGPMMGDVADLDSSVTAGTAGVLVLTDDQSAKVNDNPCMRCGKCIEACPLDLPAVQMETELSNVLLDCISCGICQFVCPAERPIVRNIQRAKKKYLNQLSNHDQL